MNKILDYSEFVKGGCHQDRGALPHGETELFFNTAKDGLCPFCKIRTEIAYADQSITYPDWLGGGYYDVEEYVTLCKICGWWKLRCNKLTTGYIDARSVETTNAVLKKYDLSSKNVPITVLQQYLNNNCDDIFYIHDNRMEKLVQAVFREHYACDVIHVGKSHDGGIDLILVDSEIPTVVQVKRRKTPSHIEKVSGIREFLGAAILHGSKNCIYVSTCNKFSEPSKLAANHAVNIGAVESYELYDFEKFCSILKLTTPKSTPWKKHLRNGW
ncbi:restriction endonuclease [Salmonella enterica subsp. enterica]|uniref:Restriction endonuclease n=2 Tax=Salmonella enterica TaxID=28901 RepID=A0A5V5HJM3_SALER|nr:restriction endonuclease [Salmonella enterica]EBS6452537.1 restriction endonuclease [Salmonella enterica subsp. enterica serovar Offa]ECG1297040.1 restriction endonuclease [Salmonella enterica subsp. enterica]EEH0656734.1 restriction endonuclease [Salmonella enterica subsp. enterica serovar Windermere]HCB4976727.1 restriction endonuclease [Salmonella enterica subsp. enterica serovar Senftenberg]HCB5025764.1 restriction endonuclease [Salmonella enterica subsp. enterica serovar Bredeney]HCB5